MARPCPVLLDDSRTADFLAFVKHVLTPGLRLGEIVVMAICPHTKGRMSRLLAIQMGLSKLEALLRKAVAQTIKNSAPSVPDLLSAFTTEESRLYFHAAGYNSKKGRVRATVICGRGRITTLRESVQMLMTAGSQL